MKEIYDLSIVDEILSENLINSIEFYEFSNVLNELTLLTDNSIYIEAVSDTTPNLRKWGADTKKNTIDTTKDVVNAYGNIVNANANLIKASWDIVMRSFNLMTRAIGFIINKVSNIPRFILKVADRAADLPNEIRRKISGDITLYITAKDIETIYNQKKQELKKRKIRNFLIGAGCVAGWFFLLGLLWNPAATIGIAVGVLVLIVIGVFLFKRR